MSTEQPREDQGPDDDLFLRALELVEDGGLAALEPLLGEHPEEADRLRARLRALADAGLLGLGAEVEPAFPERLGEFLLKRRLGAGGMGVVYLAEQPSLRREVALKLIRPDQLYFPKARERFRREVEAVAGLQHAGIVPVHLTGEDAGIPYFAMERVHGVSLAQLLERLEGRNPAELDEGLLVETLEELRRDAGDEEGPAYERRGVSWVAIAFDWMLQLAEVLEHAHRNGVLHRDVKPSNIMLTWAGRVRVLDFGLASSREGSKLTRTGSQLGSLPYMSPEQLAGVAALIDGRSDLYAVGVTLYELLTLRSPYFESSQSEAETRNRILEGGATPIRQLNPAVPWDAETVCQAAMDPDPQRRYESAAALARDLRNVLELRPIEARRPGAALRVRRWTQRHPAWTVGAVLGTLLLVVGPTAFALRERHVGKQMARARAAAELEAEIKDATLVFLTDDLLAAVRPDEVGKDASMRAVLDVASERIEGRFPDQPLVEAAIRLTIGDTYRQLGVLAAAERHLQRAWELQREHSGPESRAALTVANKLASLYRIQGRYADAESLFASTLKVQRRLFGGDDPDTLASVNNLGLVLVYLGRFEESESLLMEAYEKRVRLLAPDHRHLLVTMNNLGVLYKEWGRYAESEDWTRRELEACERAFGPDHPDTHLSRKNMANLLVTLGQDGEALELMKRVAETSERLYGPTHPTTLDSLTMLAERHVAAKRLDDAEAVLAQLEERTREYDPVSEPVIEIRVIRVGLERYLDRFDEALALVAPLVEDCTATFGAEHRLTLAVTGMFASVLQDIGDLEGAAVVMGEWVELGDPVLKGVARAEMHLAYGACLRRLGRFDESQQELTTAYEQLQSTSPTNVYTLEAALELARLGRDTRDEERLARWNAAADGIRAARKEAAGASTSD